MQIDKFNSLTKTKYWSYQNKKFRSNVLLNMIKNFLKYIINKLFLNKFGFMIVQKKSTYRPEQKSYIKNHKILFLRNQQIANFLRQFSLGFGIKLERAKLIKNIERYEELFRTVKISNLSEGMGYNNGLFFYILISHFNPKLVLESGTFKGFSTFLIHDATSRDSKIFCFDINLDRREFISKKATYFENDLSLVNTVNFSSFDFAFFDDHVSIYDRLKFSLNNKIEVVIVDDDVGLTQVHSDGWPPIPTASMIFNYNKIPKRFDWIKNGITAKADITGLKIDDICKFYKYIRFPQLSEFTGYRDTSYTSLLLKRK